MVGSGCGHGVACGDDDWHLRPGSDGGWGA